MDQDRETTTWLKWMVAVSSLVYLALFFWQPIHLPTADLGRHITTGRILLNEGLGSAVLSTNYYSQTVPQYVTPNHHWLFGVVVALIHRARDFVGLSVFALLLQLLTIGLMVAISIRLYGWKLSLVSALVAVPLLTKRIEVRPELITSLLLVISTGLLGQFFQRQLRFRWLLLAQLLLQVLWVNSHLLFVSNFVLVGTFALFSLKRWRQWAALLGSLLAVSLLNPSTWQGLLAPLTIFQTYEYMVAENQSTWFLWNRLGLTIYLYVLLVVGLFVTCVVLWLGRLMQKRLWRTWSSTPSAPLTLLALIFGLGSLVVFRMMPFFGLLLIPALASLLFHARLPQWLSKRKLSSDSLLILVPMVSILVLVGIISGLYLPNLSRLKLGLAPDNEQAIAFLQQHVPGPIFNNYDSGGLLIYSLYPTQSVFVDNRPEAYPPGFFPLDYIAPQENEAVWQQVLEKFQFQSIVFYRHDMTPWAQPFLIKRLADPNWIPVYVDADMVMLVRNTQQNQALIDQFALPKDMFSTKE